MNHRQYEDAALAEYDFGDGVNVEATGSWESDPETGEVRCPVFVRYDEDPPEADTHLVCFHVRFGADGTVNEAWADTDKGDQLGHWPRAVAI